MMFLYIPGKIKLFSPYLKIDGLSLILNAESIKEEERNTFVMSKYSNVKENDKITLTIKPFIPSSEN